MQPPQPSNTQILSFMVILSVVCAVILSILASALEERKEIAKELDRSKQMMIAARIFTHEGYFQIKDDKGNYIPAKYAEEGRLEPGSVDDIASENEILDVYQTRLAPFLVDKDGKLTTFEEAGIDRDQYIADFKKTGYYKEPLKLVYEIFPNPKLGEAVEKKPIGYVIPVNGMGLWDAIYGYIALEPNGDTVIGISWYEQKETPGLGANIADQPWQSLFPGKEIFQESQSGETDFKTAPIGITVVKGRVQEVLGDVPKAKSAVDGMAGATLTGNGVTNAYKDVLTAYRPFLIKIHEEHRGNL